VEHDEFLSQRVKLDNKDWTMELAAAHKVRLTSLAKLPSRTFIFKYRARDILYDQELH
jgi:hypothetical protein